MDKSCVVPVFLAFIIGFTLARLAYIPKISKCPQCNKKLNKISPFCPHCQFNITTYLVEKYHHKAHQYSQHKKRYHTFSIGMLIIFGVGMVSGISIVTVVVNNPKVIMGLFFGLALLLIGAIIFFLLGTKCPVCGNVNLYGYEKYSCKLCYATTTLLGK